MQPAVPHVRRDGEGSMAHPQPGMPALLAVGGRATPVLLEEHPQAHLGRAEILLRIEGPKLRIGRDAFVEALDERDERVMAANGLVERELERCAGHRPHSPSPRTFPRTAWPRRGTATSVEAASTDGARAVGRASGGEGAEPQDAPARTARVVADPPGGGPSWVGWQDGPVSTRRAPAARAQEIRNGNSQDRGSPLGGLLVRGPGRGRARLVR